MVDQTQDELNVESSGIEAAKSGIPFGGTISSFFLMLVLALGVYLSYESATNNFEPTWKAIYWIAAITTLIISLIWTVSLCDRYDLSVGHMLGGVLLSSGVVVCLFVLHMMTKDTQVTMTNGVMLVIVIAGFFGIGALLMNILKTNLVFGVFLTAIQLTLSIVLLVILFFVWGHATSKKNK
ncbi:hypothetical protein N5K21_22420 [Rhizobium pusense]|jgi:hypothetical protein|uniref:Uncharacterized protein n=1 Tax=Agrobacterium pusense TaxID=648995 RepID=A0A6H0ZPT0_9HYPH|nr:hypothetical protein [Agrobacterium pusense]MDH2091490.1 hypothetical protein [Agrobacterium pusense]QIX22629.1 hypothetical protein FOB41_16515 [Agrobacterium pusense]WCK24541.1 hypothetical protein CFBP5496_0002815 [Agrobacterium pusense]